MMKCNNRNKLSISKMSGNNVYVSSSLLIVTFQMLRVCCLMTGSSAFVPSTSSASTSACKTPRLTPIRQWQQQREHGSTPALKRLFTVRTSSSPSSLIPIFGIIRDGFDEPLDYDDEDYNDDDDDDDDDDDYLPSNEQEKTPSPNETPTDYSGCSSRQFSLGYDIKLTAYAGSLGFEEVTDWEYSNPDTGSIVDPPPFDPSQPRRTRQKSGSVVRIFRGELTGLCAAKARAGGLDVRVLAKEFSGEEALRLARNEAQALAVVQSKVCREVDGGAKKGDWASSAATRYVMGRVNGSTREDDLNLIKWMGIVAGTTSTRSPTAYPTSINNNNIPYTALLGELNLFEFLDDFNAKNDWYKALSVPPPKPDSLWLVYEYTGLTTLGTYATPALRRWSNLPLRKGLWGSLKPPPALPPFRERSRYLVRGILRGSLQALATVHAAGLAHRSIGRNSIVLSSVGQDKTEASSPLATVVPRLVVKLADFGFAGKLRGTEEDPEEREDVLRRARSFGLDLGKYGVVGAEGFAVAEDLHALGFVFVAVLLSSLAEVPDGEYVMPPTDEDSLQRLLGDIFDKDMGEFREYCEAEDIWTNVVELLDRDGGAGWDVLENMCFARERVVDNLNSGKMLTAESLLSSPFFS